MEELISKISAKITKSKGETPMSKNDLDYAYGQAKLSIEASRHCVFSIIGGDITGHYRFKKGFYGLSDIPTVFQEHIDKVLESKTPVWLDDIICVINGTIEEHEQSYSNYKKPVTEQVQQKQSYLKKNNLVGISDQPERGKTNSR